MTVADLQQYFHDLARLLQSTDAKKSATELTRIADQLSPFRGHSLADFGDFLGRAEEYSRTGSVPVVPTKSSPKPKAAAKPKTDVSAFRMNVERLYQDASTPGVTIEAIDELGPKMANFSKADLVTIAEAIGLVGMKNKAKPEIVSTIVGRIKSIKQSALRTSIIDRPGTIY